MQELTVDLNFETDELLTGDNPAYIYCDAYFVPFRLMDAGFPDYLINGGSLTISESASEKADTFVGIGHKEWLGAANTLIKDEYFSEDPSSGVSGEMNPDADWTQHGTIDQADVDITGAATTNELDEAYGERDYEIQRVAWNGSYRKFLQSQGVKTSDEALGVPERLFRWRRFVDPLRVMDPASGEFAQRYKGKMTRAFKKPIFFEEHGIVMVYASLAPKVYMLTRDPLQMLSDPSEYPSATMLNSHILTDDIRFVGGSAERISLNEVLWRGRAFLRGNEAMAARGYPIYLPTSRAEALYPASHTNWLQNDGSTRGTLTDRVFTGTPSGRLPIQFHGLITSSIKTSVPRNGTDWRPRVLVN